MYRCSGAKALEAGRGIQRYVCIGVLDTQSIHVLVLLVGHANPGRLWSPSLTPRILPFPRVLRTCSPSLRMACGHPSAVIVQLIGLTDRYVKLGILWSSHGLDGVVSRRMGLAVLLTAILASSCDCSASDGIHWQYM